MSSEQETRMKLTAELSLYPLDAGYIPIIRAFIDAIAVTTTGD